MKRDKLDILREPVEIPEIVEEKAEAAFRQIAVQETMNRAVRRESDAARQANRAARRESDAARQTNRAARRKTASQKQTNEEMRQMERKEGQTMRQIKGTGRRHSRIWRLAGAAAIVTLLGAGAAAAYSHSWSNWLGDGLQADTEQQQALEEKNMTAFPEQSVTQNGVTITAQQSIVDSYFAYLSFKVEGFEVEDGVQPGFDSVSVTVGDTDGTVPDGYNGGMSASFYNGLLMGEDGRAIHADGTPLAENEAISYTMADGSLEYRVTMQCDKKDYYIGKEVHVTLTDLDIYTGKAEGSEICVEGVWSFDWNLAGNSDARACTMEEALGDSGAVLTAAEISPISITVTCEMPRQEETEMGIDENGNEFVHTYYTEPPALTGVRLKDGTMYTRIAGAGQTGYVSEDSDTWRSISALERIIDPDEVESLLFVRSYPAEGSVLQEENLYIVPVQ